jgi:hypothetical protein
MRMPHFKLAAVCGLWLLALTQAAAEDVTIVAEIAVPGRYTVGPKNATLTVWMTASKIRQSDGYRDWIYEVSTDKRIDIDHQTREYWEGTEAGRAGWVQARYEAWKAQAERDEAEYQERKAKYDEGLAKLEAEQWSRLTPQEQDAARQKMSELLARLKDATTAEARAEIEWELLKLPKSLRDSMDKPIVPPVLVGDTVAHEKGPSRRAIAGYDCEQYLIRRTRTFADGSKTVELQQELWVAPSLEPPVPVGVRNLARFLSAVVVDEGFPLASIHTSEDGQILHSVVAVSVKKGPIDASVFALPSGYTRVDTPIDALGSYSSAPR